MLLKSVWNESIQGEGYVLYYNEFSISIMKNTCWGESIKGEAYVYG